MKLISICLFCLVFECGVKETIGQVWRPIAVSSDQLEGGIATVTIGVTAPFQVTFHINGESTVTCNQAACGGSTGTFAGRFTPGVILDSGDNYNVTGTLRNLTATDSTISVVALSGTTQGTVTLNVQAVCNVSSSKYCKPGSATSVPSVANGTTLECCNDSSRSLVINCANHGDMFTALDCSEPTTTSATTTATNATSAEATSAEATSAEATSAETTSAEATSTEATTITEETTTTGGSNLGLGLGLGLPAGGCCCAAGVAAYIFYVSITLTTATVGGKSSITIKWKAQRKPTVTYLVVWKPTGESHKQPLFVDSSQGELKIDDLDPGQTYTVEVKSKRAPSFLGSAKTIKTKSA